jgi:hypothetical protein
MIINHPHYSDITLNAEYHPVCPSKGENGYSLGEPNYPASWEVSEIFYKGQDVTNFVFDFADNIISDFGEDLLKEYPRGL